MKKTRQEYRAAKKQRLKRTADRRQIDSLRAPCVAGEIKVNVDRLAPDNSYGAPEFVKRGYYLDRPFRCRDCGAEQVWTARQQKWWYEVAKGGVWTISSRCGPCRRKERERKETARRVHLEGLDKKPRTAK